MSLETSAGRALFALRAGQLVRLDVSGPPRSGRVLVFSEDFDGSTLDPNKWVTTSGWSMNQVTTSPSNVSVSSGEAQFQLSDVNTGALITTDPVQHTSGDGFLFQVGDYAEARVWFPGNGSKLYNWPAWWTSGPDWPAAGEHDIAEVLDDGVLTINYHSPTAGPRVYLQQKYMGDSWHTYGVHRKENSADYYWDDVLVGTIQTSDDGRGHGLILNIGKLTDGPVVLGQPGAMRCDWVKVWRDPSQVNNDAFLPSRVPGNRLNVRSQSMEGSVTESGWNYNYEGAAAAFTLSTSSSLGSVDGVKAGVVLIQGTDNRSRLYREPRLLVTAGETISVSGYLKGLQSGIEAVIDLTWYNGDAWSGMTATPLTALSTSDWTLLSGEFVVPDGINQLLLAISLYGAQGNTAAFDKIVVKEAGA